MVDSRDNKQTNPVANLVVCDEQSHFQKDNYLVSSKLTITCAHSLQEDDVSHVNKNDSTKTRIVSM